MEESSKGMWALFGDERDREREREREREQEERICSGVMFIFSQPLAVNLLVISLACLRAAPAVSSFHLSSLDNDIANPRAHARVNAPRSRDVVNCTFARFIRAWYLRLFSGERVV